MVELLRLHIDPALADDQVRHEDAVLKGRTEVALGALGLLDLSANAADRLDLGVQVLAHLEVGVEHVLDECGVPEDLEGLACELELLHDREVRRRLEDAAGAADAEVANLPPTPEGQDARVGRHHRTVSGHGAMRVLQRVLEVAHPLLPSVLQRERRQRLEAAPTRGEQNGIAALEQFGVPPVPLEPHLHQAHAALAWQQAAQYDRPLPLELGDAGRRHVVEPYAHKGGDRHAVGEALEVRSAAIDHRRLGAPDRLARAVSGLVALGLLRLPILVALVLLRAAPAAGDELAVLERLPGLLVHDIALSGQQWHPGRVDTIEVAHVAHQT
mmetsp:Transcript_53561/g.143502  ORF Transcript_53561/g.143502 Transcript_53561/m.143502 type:complete len:328 (+) Transcript_53561:686-1669(+)